MAEELAKLLGDARFWSHAAETGFAFSQAFTFACCLGLILGFLLSSKGASAVEPILASIHSLPKIVLYPVVILFFGIGMPAKVAFGVLNAIIPIILFTMKGVRELNPIYLRTAQVCGFSTYQTWRRVIFPAALPEIMTGFRLGFSLALIGTLLGEMFGSEFGLGYLLLQAMHLNNTARTLALIFLIGSVAVLANVIILRATNCTNGNQILPA